MDPLSILTDAGSALQSGDVLMARCHLYDYARWRNSGGHEPFNGDRLAEALAKRIDAAGTNSAMAAA